MEPSRAGKYVLMLGEQLVSQTQIFVCNDLLTKTTWQREAE